MTTDLIARLRECAEYKLREAWRRSDGGAELCIESVLATDAADALSDLQAENQRLRATLSAITATDCYSRDECTAMARAALRSTREGG